MTTPKPFSIAAAVDPAALRREYEDTGCVQIRNFVESEAAVALHDALASRVDWHLTLLAGGAKPFHAKRGEWDEMSPARREALMALAAPSDRDSFRFLFEELILVDEDLENREPGSLPGAFADFMASPEVVDLAQAITGVTEIGSADARASRYGPGHFLTEHNDWNPAQGRRAAYVFGLTEGWRAEWGGVLLFHGADGNIEAGKVPAMNVLTIFSVPRAHSVSMVAPFAPAPRYAMSGWFRSDSTA